MLLQSKSSEINDCLERIGFSVDLKVNKGRRSSRLSA